MAKPPGKCIFCGEGGLTKEHMWADWLRAYIPREMAQHRVKSTIQFPGRIDESIKRRTGDPHSRKIRCVCERCNGGWMSKLQETTKPFLVPPLEGRSISLHKKAQTQIATWVTMMVMVSEFIDREQVAVSKEERLLFHGGLQPLRHWRIWIGRHNRKTHSLWTHNAVALTYDQDVSIDLCSVAESNTQTSTILLGKHLIIHVMSSVVGHKIIRRWKLSPQVAPHMYQIWPVRKPKINWPPDAALTDDGIELLANEFYNSVISYAENTNWRE